MPEDKSTLARLPLIDPATAPQPIAEIFELLPEINLFRVMANGGPLFPAYMKFLDLLFRPLELTATLERMLREPLRALEVLLTPWWTFTSYSLSARLAHTALGQSAPNCQKHKCAPKVLTASKADSRHWRTNDRWRQVHNVARRTDVAMMQVIRGK